MSVNLEMPDFLFWSLSTCPNFFQLRNAASPTLNCCFAHLPLALLLCLIFLCLPLWASHSHWMHSSTWNKCVLVLVAPVAMLVSTGLNGWAYLWCSTAREISSQRDARGCLLSSIQASSRVTLFTTVSPLPTWAQTCNLLIACLSSLIWNSCICPLYCSWVVRKYLFIYPPRLWFFFDAACLKWVFFPPPHLWQVKDEKSWVGFSLSE